MKGTLSEKGSRPSSDSFTGEHDGNTHKTGLNRAQWPFTGCSTVLLNSMETVVKAIHLPVEFLAKNSCQGHFCTVHIWRKEQKNMPKTVLYLKN